MKILIVSQHYWPENFSITNLAESLFCEGNDVTVLCGLPNYPLGEIFEDYKNGKNRVQKHNGVKIIRAKEHPRKHDILNRFINYYSYPRNAKKLIKILDNDYDVVLVNEISPIMVALPAIKYKYRYGAKILMYGMDLWPESLLAGGIKKDCLIYKYYRKISSDIYSKMDKILVSTKEHINYIKQLPKCKNISIDYLPQFSETYFENCEVPNMHHQAFNFMFAGNIGKAQNLDLLIEAAFLLKGYREIVFHIVGEGTEKSRLEQKCKHMNLDNVIFHGSKPKKEMPFVYSLADVMIVTLEDSPYANFTIPGKIQTYMAASKPILSAAKGSTNNLIREVNCGIAIDELTPESFAQACLNLKEMGNLNQFAKNSYEFYKTHFTKEKFMDRLILELEALKK